MSNLCTLIEFSDTLQSLVLGCGESFNQEDHLSALSSVSSTLAIMEGVTPSDSRGRCDCANRWYSGRSSPSAAAPDQETRVGELRMIIRKADLAPPPSTMLDHIWYNLIYLKACKSALLRSSWSASRRSTPMPHACLAETSKLTIPLTVPPYFCSAILNWPAFTFLTSLIQAGQAEPTQRSHRFLPFAKWPP